MCRSAQALVEGSALVLLQLILPLQLQLVFTFLQYNETPSSFSDDDDEHHLQKQETMEMSEHIPYSPRVEPLKAAPSKTTAMPPLP